MTIVSFYTSCKGKLIKKNVQIVQIYQVCLEEHSKWISMKVMTTNLMSVFHLRMTRVEMLHKDIAAVIFIPEQIINPMAF